MSMWEIETRRLAILLGGFVSLSDVMPRGYEEDGKIYFHKDEFIGGAL